MCEGAETLLLAWNQEVIMEVFASDCSPKARWRVLYKPPVEKQMADLQWRITMNRLAMNRHRAHLDPGTGE